MPPPIHGMNENVLANHFSAGSRLRREHEYPPQAVHDRRDRGEQIDEDRQRRARPAGHSSLMNRALATATGTPMMSAMIDVTIVPNRSAPPW